MSAPGFVLSTPTPYLLFAFLALVRVDPAMVGLGICLYFLFLLPFFVLLFIPYERIHCPGWGRGFSSIPFFFTLLTPLSLALTRADPVAVGVGSRIIDKLID